MSYRPHWWPQLQSQVPLGEGQLVHLAEKLHEHSTGSSEGLPEADLRSIEGCINWALDHWKEPSTEWELALKRLLVCTLNERVPREGDNQPVAGLDLAP